MADARQDIVNSDVMGAILHTPGAICLEEVPVLSAGEFRNWLSAALEGRARVAGMAALPREAEVPAARIYLALARDNYSYFEIAGFDVAESYPCLTNDFPSLHLFERELFESLNILPEGHPWLKPVRFSKVEAGRADFYGIDGDEVHEVAVGPIHAGVIECGHFRFQCRGEEVMHLEISLGYHHRGMEKMLAAGPDKRTLPLMEVAAGDTTIGHSWAYCSLLESLGAPQPDRRAQLARGIALELERLANHTGDLGALSGDVGFLPPQAYCGRLRGDYLNMTALLCGNRFGRGFLKPGGVKFTLDEALAQELLARLEPVTRDVNGAVALYETSPAVHARLHGVGAVGQGAALDLGLVGPVARACGLPRDCRYNHPQPGLENMEFNLQMHSTGDVAARIAIREMEINESARLVRQYIAALLEEDREGGGASAGAGADEGAGNDRRLADRRQSGPGKQADRRQDDRRQHPDRRRQAYNRLTPERRGQEAVERRNGEERRAQERRGPANNLAADLARPRGENGLLANSLAISAVEGWRGEIFHMAVTGPDGKFLAYKITDPSFHNWIGLALALRDQQISDFPLCNKSFNLSYCGHDL